MLKHHLLKKKSYRISHILPVIMLAMIMVLACSFSAFAEDNGLPADYTPNEADNRDLSDNTGQNRYGIPWHQFKNILTEETIDPGPVSVLCEPEDDWQDPEPVAGLEFRVYNSTTQETEAIVAADEHGRKQDQSPGR